jgi:hypothetical protein
VTDPYPAFGKIPRWNRDIVITEKIDGTNAQIFIQPLLDEYSDLATPGVSLDLLGLDVKVSAGSRKRWITPEADNHGFAKWVYENADGLVRILGPGHHYGEWWGSGINRGYGLTNGDKRFSLFNTSRWNDETLVGEDGKGILGLSVVPTLWQGSLKWSYRILQSLANLEQLGSSASPGYDRPEGIVIFHSAAGQYFKMTVENDDAPKGKQ